MSPFSFSHCSAVACVKHVWSIFCYFSIGQKTWREVTSEHSRPCQSKCAICFCYMKTRSAYFPFYPSQSHVVPCGPDLLLVWRCGVCLALTDCVFVCLEWPVSTSSRHEARHEARKLPEKQGDSEREPWWTGHFLSYLLVRECVCLRFCVWEGLGALKE